MGKPGLVLAMSPENLSATLDEPTGRRLAGLTDVDLELVVTGFDPAPSAVRCGEPVDPTDRLAGAEVLFSCWGVPRLDGQALAQMPGLRTVVHAAGSVKGFVTPELIARGITVSSAAAANAIPVAEYTVAMVLLAGKSAFTVADAYARGQSREDFYQQPDPAGPEETGDPTAPEDSEDSADAGASPAGAGGVSGVPARVRHGNLGRKVGVIGASRVGRKVLELLRVYDFELFVADPTITAADAAELGATLMEIDKLIPRCDVVSIHAPDVPATRQLIDARRLAMLRPGATLINTARGRLLDTAALIERLRGGDLYAVLDVTDPEPLPADSPLFTLPNVIVTPHVAGSLGTEVARMGALAVQEVARYVGGEPYLHQVDLTRWDQLA